MQKLPAKTFSAICSAVSFPRTRHFVNYGSVLSLVRTETSCSWQVLASESPHKTSDWATYLILSLSQNWLWSAAIFSCLSMAACMIDATANLNCVHPDKLLCIIQPLHFKLFLANRTDPLGHDRVVRNRNPLKLRFLSCGLGLFACAWDCVA